MKRRHTYLFCSDLALGSARALLYGPGWSGSKLIIGTVSAVSLGNTKRILLISDKYRLPIPSGRLSAILSELYFGACQTAGNKTHFITVTCSVFFATPSRVHKLLDPAPRTTLFDNGAKEKNPLISGGLCCLCAFNLNSGGWVVAIFSYFRFILNLLLCFKFFYLKRKTLHISISVREWVFLLRKNDKSCA